jgi:hypothetical protein
VIRGGVKQQVSQLLRTVGKGRAFVVKDCEKTRATNQSDRLTAEPNHLALIASRGKKAEESTTAERIKDCGLRTRQLAVRFEQIKI